MDLTDDTSAGVANIHPIGYWSAPRRAIRRIRYDLVTLILSKKSTLG